MIAFLKKLLGLQSNPESKAVVICPHCRYPNKESATFCNYCGDRFGVEEWER